MDSGAGKWRIPDEGLWGFSHCAFYDTWYPWSGATYAERLSRLVGDLGASGANSFRPQIHWHRVEPVLIDPPGVRIARPEDVTDEQVEAYSKGREGVYWDDYDRMIDALVAAGIEPHIVVAAAYDFQLPSFASGATFERAIPDRVGRDRYIARAYLHARAAARRYRDRVHIWQLENELNCAGETLLLTRWRTGRSWLDRGFLTALLEAISNAVRQEDPAALTSHNIHTDWRIIKGIYDWRNDVKRWLPFLDVVGVDSYPNYIWGWPSLGRAVGRKVGRAVEVAEGRPVMVLESGYPVRPRRRGMSEKRQAEYVRDAIGSSVDAGAVGFYYYMVCSPEGYPVEGPWSNQFFQSIEHWWGMVRRDDTRRPSWFAFQEAVRRAGKVCTGRS